MKLDKEQLFGVLIMIVGSYVVSDGLISGKVSFATLGFILMGFAVFLWTAENIFCTEE